MLVLRLIKNFTSHFSGGSRISRRGDPPRWGGGNSRHGYVWSNLYVNTKESVSLEGWLAPPLHFSDVNTPQIYQFLYLWKGVNGFVRWGSQRITVTKMNDEILRYIPLSPLV